MKVGDLWQFNMTKDIVTGYIRRFDGGRIILETRAGDTAVVARYEVAYLLEEAAEVKHLDLPPDARPF